MKESDIQRTICEYLALKKYFFWRNNTIPPVQTVNGKMQFRRMPPFSMKGTPDILLLLNGVFWGIEVKAEKGRQSTEQKEFEQKMIDNKGMYVLVRSLEDIIKLGF